MKLSAKKTLTSLGIAAIISTGAISSANAAVHISESDLDNSSNSFYSTSYTPSIEGSSYASNNSGYNYSSNYDDSDYNSSFSFEDTGSYQHYAGTPILNKNQIDINSYTDHIKNLKRKAIVESALSQLGDTQDCTALATNSLRSAGIEHAGWPDSYLGLGKHVSRKDAKPGDLLVYLDNGSGHGGQGVMMANGRVQQHVAVVVANDNGKLTVVHGGWNGNTTALWGADIPYASSPIVVDPLS